MRVENEDVLTSKAVLLLPRLLVVDVRLGPVVLLEQSAPGGHVDVHLLRPRHLALLSEDLPLSPQLGLASDQWVEKLNLWKIFFKVLSK